MRLNELIAATRDHTDRIKSILCRQESAGGDVIHCHPEVYGLLYTAWMQGCQLEATLTLLDQHDFLGGKVGDL